MKDRAALHATTAVTIAVVLIGLIVLVIVDPGRFRSVLNAGPATAPTASEDGEAIATPITVPGSTPPPPVSPVTTIDPAHPFAGSPAADYPTGIAGLRMPPAKRVGAFSAQEVARALELARRYFAATRLDPGVIAGNYPTRALALLDPKGKESLEHIRQAFRSPTEKNDPTTFVTRLDPRRDVLHGTVIKVNGSATVRPGHADELVVAYDVLVVYAVRRIQGSPEVTRVILHEHGETRTYHGLDTTPGTVWLGTFQGQWAGIHCGADPGGYVRPQYPSEWRDSDPSPADDPYDTRRPMSGGTSGCRDASRI